MEGINLYIKVVKVFSFNRQYAAYVGVGWGRCRFSKIVWCEEESARSILMVALVGFLSKQTDTISLTVKVMELLYMGRQ